MIIGNNNIKKPIIVHDNYKKDTSQKNSDLGNEINSNVYSINSLESFCYENCIQLYYYEPKNHKFYIKVKNDFINPLASPCAGAPTVKYGDINIETSSPGEVKGLNVS